MKNDCIFCTQRSAGCHSNCKSYLEFKKELEILNTKKRYDKWLSGYTIYKLKHV